MLELKQRRYWLTPLCSAVGNGLVEVVKMLIESGADEHLVSYCGEDALSYASQNGHEEALLLREVSWATLIQQRSKVGFLLLLEIVI